jgi:hypothetical protein
MRFLEDLTRDRLNLEWLRSEWWKGHAGADRSLIDDADLSDPIQNRRRAVLLAYRSPILDGIPRDARYRSVLIEQSDLPKLYLLTCWDWFLDTGRTFQLVETRRHLRRNRGGLINGVRQDVDHAAEVERKLPYVERYRSDESDELLVLVADNSHGPFTIIDGTHRAAALLQLHDRAPNVPWRAILIESPEMASYRWHVGGVGTPI